MAKNQTLIEDMITLGSNIMGNLLEARHEMKAQAKQRMEGVIRQLDIVSREEFDVAFAMLSKARLMQEQLDERLQVIESHLNLSKAKSTHTPSTKGSKTMKVNLPSVKKDKRRTRRK